MKNLVNIFLFKLGYIDFKTKLVGRKSSIADIPPSTIVIVGGSNWSKWAFMKCPCGCGEVLTLSLMKSYEPTWKLSIDMKNRVSLRPSVWKQDGCRSHFFVKKSRLIWV